MATRGDREHATGAGGRSFHAVRPDAFNYVWDNSIEPELEIDSGEVVEFRVRDASDEQLRADSTSEDVAKLDFDHVNPVSGPIYVRDARPGDVLAVEILEFRPMEWGWTALIPGFGLLADEFPEPWLRISRVDAERGRVIFAEGIELPYEPFPGTIGVAPGESGPHSIVPPSRWGCNMDTKHLRAGTTLYLPVGVEGALFLVGDTHSSQGDGEVCGTAIVTAMEVSLRLSVRREFPSRRHSTVFRPARSPGPRGPATTSRRAWPPTSWRRPSRRCGRRCSTSGKTTASRARVGRRARLTARAALLGGDRAIDRHHGSGRRHGPQRHAAG